MTTEGSATRRSYHHGNLRPVLIETAVKLLDELGPSGLTLRALARRVGVTHAAPYRHFRDKAALLDAVAQEGHQALARRLHAALATGSESDSPERRFGRLALAYLDFAQQHPALYRLLFRSADVDAPAAQAADDPRTKVLDQIDGALRTPATPSHSPDHESRQLALVLWAQLHGRAALILDRPFPSPPTDTLIATTLQCHFHSIAQPR